MDILSLFLSDPVVARVFAATLSVIFLVGGWQKLRDPVVFAAAIENYQVLPEGLAAPVARLLPLFELFAGVALLFPQTCDMGGAVAAVLLLMVTAAVAINLWRGQRAIDCGCGGMSSQPISWALVARNGVLLLLTVPAAQQGAGRALFIGDYVTLVGGVLALVGLYVAVNQLMSNAPFQIAHRHSHRH